MEAKTITTIQLPGWLVEKGICTLKSGTRWKVGSASCGQDTQQRAGARERGHRRRRRQLRLGLE